MLRAKFVHVHYKLAQALHGVTLEVGAGKIVCLIGRNGAGKTTTLKAIMGLARVSSGEIAFLGERIRREAGLSDRSPRLSVCSGGSPHLRVADG